MSAMQANQADFEYVTAPIWADVLVRRRKWTASGSVYRGPWSPTPARRPRRPVRRGSGTVREVLLAPSRGRRGRPCIGEGAPQGNGFPGDVPTIAPQTDYAESLCGRKVIAGEFLDPAQQVVLLGLILDFRDRARIAKLGNPAQDGDGIVGHPLRALPLARSSWDRASTPPARRTPSSRSCRGSRLR